MMTLSASLMAQGLNGLVWWCWSVQPKWWGGTCSSPWSSHLRLPGWGLHLVNLCQTWQFAVQKWLLHRNLLWQLGSYKSCLSLWGYCRSGSWCYDCIKDISNFQQCSTHLSRGHCGIAGNEKVDTLAKQASSSCFIGPEQSVGISVPTIYSIISSWAVREQQSVARAI